MAYATSPKSPGPRHRQPGPATGVRDLAIRRRRRRSGKRSTLSGRTAEGIAVRVDEREDDPMTSETSFDGRLAVVTGAASGIGAALAERLAALGARLILADVDAVRVRSVAERLGAAAQPTDVADPGDMARLAQSAGEASLICLNAGVVSTDSGPVWEATPDEWVRVFAINVGGVVNGLRAFV